MWWKCIVDQDCLGRWYQISLKWTLLDSPGTASPHTPSGTNKHQFSVVKKIQIFDICIHIHFHAFLVVFFSIDILRLFGQFLTITYDIWLGHFGPSEEKIGLIGK